MIILLEITIEDSLLHLESSTCKLIFVIHMYDLLQSEYRKGILYIKDMGKPVELEISRHIPTMLLQEYNRYVITHLMIP